MLDHPQIEIRLCPMGELSHDAFSTKNMPKIYLIHVYAQYLMEEHGCLFFANELGKCLELALSRWSGRPAISGRDCQI